MSGVSEDIARLESLVANKRFHDVLSSTKPNGLSAAVMAVLATPRLALAQELRWEDDFGAWWDAPILRAARACLEISAYAIRAPDSSTLSASIVAWVSLLCEPIARPHPTNVLYDPSLIELYVTLLSSLVDFPIGLEAILASPDAARTVVALLVTSFSGCNTVFPSSYTSVFALLHAVFDIRERGVSKQTFIAGPGSIWFALHNRCKEVASAAILALRWIVGAKAGHRTPRIPPDTWQFLISLRLITSIPALRAALVERGLVPSLCLLARRLVRGELEEHCSISGYLSVLLDIIEDNTYQPQRMREALDSHIMSTILCIPDVYTKAPLCACMPLEVEKELTARALAFVSRLSALVIFPSLIPSFRRSFRHVEALVNRGAITFRGEFGSLLEAQYIECKISFTQRAHPTASRQCHVEVYVVWLGFECHDNISTVGLPIQWADVRVSPMPSGSILFDRLSAAGLVFWA